MLSEEAIQAKIRLLAPYHGFTLYRNNVGALLDMRGIPVRYGLANESKKENEKTKSGDLIGWESFIITPDMVGMRIARFVSREIKEEGWSYTGTPREQAQLKWANLVNAAGGDACFVCTVDGLVNPAYARNHHAR
jgi:hypothetical protein